jgi:adenylate cyclase
MFRKLAAGLGLGALAALIVLGLSVSTDLLDRQELTTYDWRMRLAVDPGSVSQDIVLVELNDATLREMSGLFGRWPWPRVTMAYVIDFLKRGPAKVIAVDVQYTELDKVAQYDFAGDLWTGRQSDNSLVKSVKEAGSVVLLADAVYEGLANGPKDQDAATWKDAGYTGDRAVPRPLILAPFQALTDAAAGLGHNFLTRDADGPARRMAPFVKNGTQVMPSLGVAAALHAWGAVPSDVSAEGSILRIRDRRVPLVRESLDGVDQWTMLINYRAPALIRNRAGEMVRPYPSYEFRHLFLAEQQLLMNQQPLVDPAAFKDKIVFIGFTASGLMDVFGTPLSNDENGSMPGIQLHASMTDSLLANRFIRPASDRSRIVSVVITALAVGLLAAFLPFFVAAGASLGIIGGWTVFSISAFKDGVWWNLVQPSAVGALALFFGTAYQYLVEGKEKRKVAKLFGRYVSRDVYAQLMAHPDLAELGGKRRDMTVLFSDIRGFTSVTEKGNPEELVSQLNEYFSRMVAIVFRNTGTVDKFVGDMVMALFSAPLDDPDHAEHGVQTAIEMVRELGELNKAWAARGMTQLDIGIGVNSGDMVAGNIGSSSIMSYTVIGWNP